MRTDDELRAAIAREFWWHDIELRPGIRTGGLVKSDSAVGWYGIPEDLTGASVLDIGAWDGAYSFECERRGAARVVSADVWETAGRGAFDLARDELGSKAEPLECSVYDLDPAETGRFDMVLFLGVLYHLKHPWLALEKVAAVTGPGGLIIIDTITDFGPAPRPAVAYYFGSEVNGDPTTWCAPNAAAVTGMLRDAGCQAVTNPVPNYWGNRAVFHALKGSDARVESHGRREHYQRHKYHPPGAP